MDGWYYSRNGQSVGPIALAELKQLAAAGEVSPEDQVWHPSLAGWTVARKVPGLVPLRGGRTAPVAVNAPPPQSAASQAAGSQAITASPPAAQPAAASTVDSASTATTGQPATTPDFEPIMVQRGGRPQASSAGDDRAASEVSFRTIQILHHGRLWLAIVAVAMFVISLATLLTAIALLSGSSNFAQMLRQQSGSAAVPVTFQIVLCAIVYLIIAVLAAILGIHLIRALARIGTLMLNRTPHDLEEALAVQLTCWRFAALFVIASVVLTVVIALVL